MKILVAGYGNPFRQDDRVGHELTPMIARYLEKEGIQVEEWIDQQLLPEIVEDMKDKDLAIFIDACADDSKGEFDIQTVVPQAELDGLNIHSMGPGWILDLMEKLEIPCPKTILISVAGVSFDFSEEMTPLCRERMEKAFSEFRSWWSRQREKQQEV